MIDPAGDRGVLSEQMAAPFSAPGDPHATHGRRTDRVTRETDRAIPASDTDAP